MVPAGEEPTSNYPDKATRSAERDGHDGRRKRHTWVELVKRDPELAETREELGLDGALDRVVDPLVDRRLNVSVGLADADDLCDFPSAYGTMSTWGLRRGKQKD